MTEEQQDQQPHVAPLRTIERQIGENVLAALNDDDAIAVITTIAAGVRNDRVVSVPLSREQVESIQEVLQQAQDEARQAEEEEQTDGRSEGFLGFHTVLDQEDGET